MKDKLIKRTIMIFPQLKNIDVINSIRDKYDPLAEHVRPHITLVFTFESNLISEDIKEHLTQVLKEVSPFKLTLQQIVKIDNPLGKYLFLSIKEGKEQLVDLNKRLYTGILQAHKPEWLNENTYLPHMTLGCFASTAELETAYKETQVITESFSTIVEKISVEIVDDNEDSIIEAEVSL